MSSDGDFPSCAPEKIVSFFKLWCEVSPSSRKSDMQPERLYAFLPYIFIMNVEVESFSYRIAGSHIENSVCSKLKGKKLHEVRHGQALINLTKLFQDVLLEKSAIYYHSQLYSESKYYAQYHRLVVPLFDNDEEVSTILGLFIEDIKVGRSLSEISEFHRLRWH